MRPVVPDKSEGINVERKPVFGVAPVQGIFFRGSLVS